MSSVQDEFANGIRKILDSRVDIAAHIDGELRWVVLAHQRLSPRDPVDASKGNTKLISIAAVVTAQFAACDRLSLGVPLEWPRQGHLLVFVSMHYGPVDTECLLS